MTSASVLIVLLVGTVVGALVGLLVGGSIGAWYLALLAGFLGSTIAVVVRNLVLARGAGLGPYDSKTPVLVIVYAAIASLGAGSLALEVEEHSGLGGAPAAGGDRTSGPGTSDDEARGGGAGTDAAPEQPPEKTEGGE